MTDTRTAPAEAPDAQPVASPAISRRSVIAAAGAVGAAGVLAACGSTNANDALNAAKSAAGDAASQARSAASEAASAVKSAASEIAGKVATVTEVPVGGGKVIQQAKIVVTQPTAGDYKAFTAVCPHQGCLVDKVENNEISCPCHGSLFSAEDGSVIKGPATQPLAKAGINVNGNDITVG